MNNIRTQNSELRTQNLEDLFSNSVAINEVF